jgi:hypothetical protein
MIKVRLAPVGNVSALAFILTEQEKYFFSVGAKAGEDGKPASLQFP